MNNETMAFDDEKSEPSGKMEAEPMEESETCTIPISALGGRTPKPGETVRLQVVDVSEEDGTFTAKYAEGAKGAGIAKAASAFDEAM